MKKTPRNSLHLFIAYLGPRWPIVLALFIGLTVQTQLQVRMPSLLGTFIDKALSGASERYLFGLAVSYFAIGVAVQLLSLGADFLSQDLAWRSTNALRGDLFEHSLRLDLGFHNHRTPGEMIQRIDGDVGSLSNFLSVFTVRIFGHMLLAAGILYRLIRQHLWMGLGLLGFSVITFIVFIACRGVAIPARKQSAETLAKLMGFVEERLGGLQDIRPNGAAGFVMRGLYLLGRQRHKTHRKSCVMGSVRWVIAMSTLLVGYLIALASGAWLMSRGRMTIGGVYMLYSYTRLLIEPLYGISLEFQDLQTAAAGMSRILDIFSLSPERGSDSSSVAGHATGYGEVSPVSLELRDVTFRYADSDGDASPVLNQVTFRVEAGRTLGVVGRTGSGKSTLARLLLRFYEPSSGQVVIGGDDTRDLTLEKVRSTVALVTQEVQLFKGTVRDNLTMFDPLIPDEAVIQVIETACMGEWLRGQRDGLDTLLGSGGSGLSAGQAQLLAFARVLLRDPGLVVLDEASSRLDPATERVLDDAMGRLLSGRTAVVIAHRLATLGKVDDILVLESGRVAEFGERAALAADPNSRFARLLKLGGEELLA